MSVLVFCTGGSHKSGIGHIMRCQALAQAAEEKGLESLFLVNDAAQQFILQRHDWTGRQISAGESEQDLINQVTRLAEEKNAVAIVLDGYDFSEGFIKIISAIKVPVVLLDDVCQPGFQYVDIICNPAGEPWREDYTQANPTAMLCLGASYRLLRREFSVTTALPVHRRFSLTINMGGSDPAGFTLPLLQALTSVIPDAPFRVVTGPGFKPTMLAALEAFIADSDCAIQHVHNCQDMADLWVNARLAVAAAGGSQFELAACQTPSMLLIVAENQRAASQQAASQGWCQVVNAETEVDMKALAAQVKLLWLDEPRLDAMHAAAQSTAVTDGAWQLLGAIAQKRDDYAETTC